MILLFFFSFFLLIIATQIFGVVIFVLANAFFTVLDLTGKPEFLLKYKIQEDKAVPVSIIIITGTMFCSLYKLAQQI